MVQIQKRDKTLIPFNKQKIINAIEKAFIEVDGILYESDTAKDIADDIENILYRIDETTDKPVTVEQIQDLVEDFLMRSERRDVARAYIRFRYKKEVARNHSDDFINAVSEKLRAKNVQNQNANVDEHSFGGRMGEASNLLMEKYALDYCMSSKARHNHIENRIYIHDLNSYAVGMHNCVGRETAFLTTDGIKTFYDFEDGDIIEVLTHTGEIKKAIVKKFGTQQLYKITLKKGGSITKVVRATKDHRWLLQSGEFTSSLAVGDKLFDAPEIREFDFENASDKEKLMWCKGFGYGDGTLEYNKNKITGEYKKDNRVRIRLCGKKEKYLDRFNIEGCSVNSQTAGGEHIVKIFNYDKTVPTFNTYEELKAFVNGLYSADGYQTGIYGIQFTGIEYCNFVEKYFEPCGYYVSSIRDKSHQVTNYGKRSAETKEYHFLGKPNRFKYTVKNIEVDALEEVWCLEVEDNHTFILSGGIVTGNCLSIPYDDLLAKGFNTRQTDVRPANSINTAFQLVAVIAQIQSLQQFGGVSATHLDWTMVPYVRKSFTKHLQDGLVYCEHKSEYKAKRFLKWLEHDTEGHPDGLIHFDDEEFKALHPEAWEYAMDLTERETRQAVEGMYHNLNTLQSRSGNQLPFSSINFGTCTEPEGRLVIKSLLEVSIEGLGKLHKTSIFPCSIFQCMKGVNRAPGDPNYDLFQLALRSTAQRLYPNYANVDWSGNAGYDKNDPRTYFSTMGCRTANGYDINGLGQMKDGRGNICPVTVIMPTVAMEAKLKAEELGEDAVETFLDYLDYVIHDAKDMLLERFDWICNQSPASAKFMYENGTMYGYNPEEGIRSALKHGTLALGQIGLAETLQLLIGCDHTSPEGMKLAKRIEQLFKDRCAEFKEEYQLNFGVYYTPAETLCYKSMKKFQAKYGKIENVSENEFFTNSMHVPVWKDVDVFDKIYTESQLTGYSSAGCITYVELDSTIKNNLEALEQIVNFAMDNDIPYFAVNVPNDTCLSCGYCDEFNDKCPVCGSTNIQQLRRVTGYLTGDYKSAFNRGKQQETEMRIKHNIGGMSKCVTQEPYITISQTPEPVLQ